MENQSQRPQVSRNTSDRREVPPRPPPPCQSSAPNSISDVKTYRDFKSLSDLVHKYVDSALVADEQGDTALALQSYLEGQRLIDIALGVNCASLVGCNDNRIDQAKTMQQKMNKTKQQVFYRLQELQPVSRHEQQDSASAAVLPSYEEALNETSPPAYMDDEMMQLGDSILSAEEAAGQLSDGTGLFCVPDGVQVFYISPEGLVSAPSYPSPLNIVKLAENAAQHSGAPPAFLHVGDWMYPLIPGTSPALRTNYGAYLFPDVMSQVPGSAVGLMLPETLPESERAKFEQLIQSFTAMERQEEDFCAQTQQSTAAAARPTEKGGEKENGEEEEDKEEEKDTAAKISSGIITAAEWFAWGVGKGAEKAGELIKVGSKKLRERTAAATTERTVDPRIQQGVVYARVATSATVKVTGYIVSQLGQATMAIGRQLAPHVRKQGEKYMPKKFTNPSEDGGKSTMDGVVEVAASGIQGIGTVYLGLEAAGKSLGKSLATETVQVVQHKYGSQAGDLAKNSMYAAGNAVMTVYNSGSIGVKAVAKRAAKDTGRAVLEDFHTSRAGPFNESGNPSGAPGSTDKSEGGPSSESYKSSKH